MKESYAHICSVSFWKKKTHLGNFLTFKVYKFQEIKKGSYTYSQKTELTTLERPRFLKSPWLSEMFCSSLVVDDSVINKKKKRYLQSSVGLMNSGKINCGASVPIFIQKLKLFKMNYFILLFKCLESNEIFPFREFKRMWFATILANRDLFQPRFKPGIHYNKNVLYGSRIVSGCVYTITIVFI